MEREVTVMTMTVVGEAPAGLQRESADSGTVERDCEARDTPWMNLLAFLVKVTGSLHTDEGVDVMLLDFAKAFDKVPDRRLLLKLQAHGITNKLLDWIRQWLRCRVRKVGIRGSLSDWIEVLSGFPQDSVLGPILFLVYINDLDCGIDNWILKFAGDTKLFGGMSTKSDGSRLQDDLSKLVQWSQEWQMLFNINKCSVMHIGNIQKYTR